MSNSYYQPNAGLDITYETARINRGTSPNISISTKGTQTIAGIVNGDPLGHPWLDGWIANSRSSPR